MTYATLMVQLVLGGSNAGLLQIAGELATRLKAGVIGIVASPPVPMFYGDGYVDGAVIEQGRLALEQEMNEAQAQFRSALAGQVERLEWRSSDSLAMLPDYLACQARSADLLITSALSGEAFDSARAVDPGDLIMQAGRPVLVVPAGVDRLPLVRAMVAWKDTREARRAAHDALPLLRLAAHVTVLELAVEDDLAAARGRVADVADWLARQGVVAQAMANPSSGNDANRLVGVARDEGVDLIVAGAYGHSRLREWMLGGVTRELLLKSGLCTLLSH